jgi:aspartyl-tRNA(Asn)/glutamyl-tRNA(Gln) amidotransferase subunit C
MNKHQTITSSQVKHIAQLANIPVTLDEENKLAQAFNETLDVVDDLKTVDVKNVEPTHQVTGLENISREDRVTEETIFSQQQALANAQKTFQGYFMVPRVIDEKDE